MTNVDPELEEYNGPVFDRYVLIDNLQPHGA